MANVELSSDQIETMYTLKNKFLIIAKADVSVCLCSFQHYLL